MSEELTEWVPVPREALGWLDNHYPALYLRAGLNRRAQPVAQAERTPTDFALEFAEYMATSAERLITTVNDLARAEQECDDGQANPSDVDAARETVTEMLGAMRSSIYEFRKRRDRAAQPPAEPAAPADEVAAVLRYCRDVQQEGTVNERVVAQTVARMLAQPPAAAPSVVPEPATDAEPLGWAQIGLLNGKNYLRQVYDRTPYPPPADIVRNLNLVPVFAAHSPRPEPLSDADIDTITREQWGEQLGVMFQAHRAYARAIEAAIHSRGRGEG